MKAVIKFRPIPVGVDCNPHTGIANDLKLVETFLGGEGHVENAGVIILENISSAGGMA
jgi:hypothetical protein